MVDRVENRFDLERRLKEGNGVETYAGVDTTDGSPVVVKTVATAGVSAALRLRLEHEAYVLERLGTDTFRPLLASGYEDGRFYLVQPRIAGETLQDRLAGGPLPLPDVLRVAIDVLGALQLAHDQGVFHRDVKPANIIVSGDGADEDVDRAVLIDFGLAQSTGLDASLRDEPVGTARYLAPEAAGLIESGVDHRSDLYAVGVVLFECLAGRPPFTGDTVGEVLRQHLSVDPPALRGVGVDVPRAVDGVVQRLLAKEPDERYQSAAAVLADLEAIATQLRAGVAEPAVMTGAARPAPVPHRAVVRRPGRRGGRLQRRPRRRRPGRRRPGARGGRIGRRQDPPPRRDRPPGPPGGVLGAAGPGRRPRRPAAVPGARRRRQRHRRLGRPRPVARASAGPAGRLGRGGGRRPARSGRRARHRPPAATPDPRPTARRAASTPSPSSSTCSAVRPVRRWSSSTTASGPTA